MVEILLHVDYRPHVDEFELVLLTLPDAYGDALQAHEHMRTLVSHQDRFYLTDREGETWSFIAETVRAFWTRGTSRFPNERMHPS